MKAKRAQIVSSISSRPFRLARLGLLLALGLATGLLAAFHFAGNILCLEAGPRQGEVIVVLGGETEGRAQQALELFMTGAAPRVIVSGDGVGNPIQQRLVRGGVPLAAIELEPNSRNTKENAEFTTRLLKQHGMHHAIIVTSWFHSRRAMNCFRSFAPKIQFSSAPSYSFNGLRAEGTHVLQEYAKTVWYVLRYRISPWQRVIQ